MTDTTVLLLIGGACWTETAAASVSTDQICNWNILAGFGCILGVNITVGFTVLSGCQTHNRHFKHGSLLIRPVLPDWPTASGRRGWNMMSLHIGESCSAAQLPAINQCLKGRIVN